MELNEVENISSFFIERLPIHYNSLIELKFMRTIGTIGRTKKVIGGYRGGSG